MTSSKNPDSKSDLNGKVTNKGDVRIWAGGMQNEGDLTSAPFTVTDAGVLKCQSAEGNSITLQDGTIYFNINGSVYHLGITMVNQIGLIVMQQIVLKHGIRREDLIQI